VLFWALTLQETKSAVKDAPKATEPTSNDTTKEPSAAAEGAVDPAAAHVMASDPAFDRHGLQETIWSQIKPRAPMRPPTGIGGILFPGMID
jgi:hypothetical protein